MDNPVNDSADSTLVLPVIHHLPSFDVTSCNIVIDFMYNQFAFFVGVNEPVE